jgi:hypothetical protein
VIPVLEKHAFLFGSKTTNFLLVASSQLLELIFGCVSNVAGCITVLDSLSEIFAYFMNRHLLPITVDNYENKDGML